MAPNNHRTALTLDFSQVNDTDPHEVADGIDQLLGLDANGQSYDTDDFTGLQNTGNNFDYDATAPQAQVDRYEAAAEVEDTLLDLIASDEREAIQFLIGASPRPQDWIPTQSYNWFGNAYAMACTIRPAIRWYARLAAMYSKEQFFIENDALVLDIEPALFRTGIQPFLSDFNPADTESPITVVVLTLAKVVASMPASTAPAKQARRTHNERGDFDPTKVAFRNADIAPNGFGDEEWQVEAMMSDTTPAFENPKPLARARQLDISLVDLSNKAISEYLHQRKFTEAEVLAFLAAENFPRARVEGIIGIFKYLNITAHTASRLPKRSEASAPPGSTEFKFE